MVCAGMIPDATDELEVIESRAHGEVEPIPTFPVAARNIELVEVSVVPLAA
jgi:hypothetical protein